MRGREVGWGIFLAGLPFAQFLCPWPQEINQYAAQNFWAYGGLAALVAASLAWPLSAVRPPRNLPLACWWTWTAWSVLGLWITVMRTQHGHPIGVLVPWTHYSAVGLFYLAASRAWTADTVRQLCRWIAGSGLVVVAYGWCQVAGLDQFYRSIDRTIPTDIVMGTIGNTTHFGLYLTCLLPFFLWHPHPRWRWAALPAVGLLPFTASASASVLALGVMLLWMWWEHRSLVWGLAVLSLLGGAWAWLTHPAWFNPEGRWTALSYFWQHYLVGNDKLQITGAGLGRVMSDFLQKLPDWPNTWAHLHNEYAQVLVEQGIIGVSLLLWALVMAVRLWGRLPRTADVKLLGATGSAFLLAAAFHQVAHVWLLAVFGLFVYCSVYVLSAESV